MVLAGILQPVGDLLVLGLVLGMGAFGYRHGLFLATLSGFALLAANVLALAASGAGAGLAVSLGCPEAYALPAVFAAGCEGVPSFDDERAEMQARFYKTLSMMCPEFQTAVGYPRTAKGKANLSLAKNAIAERFKCLAMTLEMPFKDVETAPSEDGWTPQRSAAFGADYLGAILDALPALRAKREAEDAAAGK